MMVSGHKRPLPDKRKPVPDHRGRRGLERRLLAGYDRQLGLVVTHLPAPRFLPSEIDSVNAADIAREDVA